VSLSGGASGGPGVSGKGSGLQVSAVSSEGSNGLLGFASVQAQFNRFTGRFRLVQNFVVLIADILSITMTWRETNNL
jgi:hypothetical protein